MKRFISFLLIGIMAGLSNSYSQIKGPVQPDYIGFTPIAGSNLVDPYTGQFKYSIPVITIPGPDGSGYTLTLGYNSNTKPDDEASWVGYGWTLSPGSINRNKRGFPDEFNDVEVLYYRKRLPNNTVTHIPKAGLEYLSDDTKEEGEEGKPDDLRVNASASMILSYNNLTGYRQTYSLGLGAVDIANLNMSKSSDGSYAINVEPTVLYSLLNDAIYDEESLKDQGEFFLENSWNRTLVNNTTAVSGQVTSSLAFLMSYRGSAPTTTEEYSGSNDQFIPALRADIAPLVGGQSSYSYITSSIKYPSNPLSKRSFGYLHAGSDKLDAASIMDYFVVNDRGIKEDDKYLYLPFPNVDDFSVSGNGINGVFRAWSSVPQSYRPNKVTSVVDNNIYGLSASFGAGFGAGANYGYGDNTSVTYEWDGTTNPELDYVFRFRNDKGGSVDIDHSSNASQRFDPIATSLGAFSIKDRADLETEKDQMTMMSKKIDPLYFGNIDAGQALNIPENVPEITGLRSEMIVGYRITDENGTVYEYHQPVFNREEVDLSYGINDLGTSGENYTFDHYHAYVTGIDDENPMNSSGVVMGQKISEPYASTYLLTAIYSVDYVDLGEKGPSNDDLGNWTRFTYERSAGSTDKHDDLSDWFKWRSPYNGLYYARGELSNRYDDRGNSSYGYKELYYLATVETKSHIAYFVNNKSTYEVKIVKPSGIEDHTIEARKAVVDSSSGSVFIERLDSYPAVQSEALASASHTAVTWSEDPSGSGELPLSNPSRFLERIELYAKKTGTKDTLSDLVSTTNFVYDKEYPIWIGQPNTYDYMGKLTLEKIWTDYSNIKKPRVSAYEFAYTYPQTGYGYPSKYSSFLTENQGLAETPIYNPLNKDEWGYYYPDGISITSGSTPLASVGSSSSINLSNSRNYNYQNWINQKTQYLDYDPAAYNLKRIVLPSDGEIHVYYEQNEYTSVQDRTPMIMVPVDSEVNGDYTLALSDVFDTAGLDMASYVQDLDTYFEDQTVFFRFLFGLSQNDESQVQLSRCATEFVEGWASVSDVELDNGKIKLKTPRFETVSGEEAPIPKVSCEKMVVLRRSGLYDEDSRSDCDPCTNRISFSWGAAGETRNPYGWDSPDEICKHYNKDHSYFKIPMPKGIAKKGGGNRVKRIVMLDRFDDDYSEGEARLYGTEYLYQEIGDDNQLIASGVASNEPDTDLSNSLRENLKTRSGQPAVDWQGLGWEFDSPEEAEYYEAPLVKPLLPGLSVNYSSIISKSIYDGVNSNGFSIDRYLTYKDYPYDFTIKDEVGGQEKNIKGFSYTNASIEASTDWAFLFRSNEIKGVQSYQFISHGLAGKRISQSIYAGKFSDYLADPVSSPLTSETKYEYFEPTSPVPFWDSQGSQFIDQFNGLDLEIVADTRALKKEEFSLRFNADGVYFPPAASIMPFYTTTETFNAAAVINKMVSLPTYVKSIETVTDGIRTKVENIAFDQLTGKPLITKTYDDYDITLGQYSSAGTINNVEIPAHHAYDIVQDGYGVGTQIKSGDHIKFDLLGNGSTSTIVLDYADEPKSWYISVLESLQVGDIVGLYPSGSDLDISEPVLYSIQGKNALSIQILPIDTTQTVAPSGEVDIKIIDKRGQNQLNSSVGNVTTYGDLDFSTWYSVADIEEKNKRLNVTDAFNDIIWAGRDTTVLLSDISPGLSVLGINGESVPNTDIRLDFTFSDPVYIDTSFYSAGLMYANLHYEDSSADTMPSYFEITYIHTKDTVLPSESAPLYQQLVDDLNGILNNNWRVINLDEPTMKSIGINNYPKDLWQYYTDEMNGSCKLKVDLTLDPLDFDRLTGIDRFKKTSYRTASDYQLGENLVDFKDTKALLFEYQDTVRMILRIPNIDVVGGPQNLEVFPAFTKQNCNVRIGNESAIDLSTLISTVSGSFSSNVGNFTLNGSDIEYIVVDSDKIPGTTSPTSIIASHFPGDTIFYEESCSYGHRRKYIYKDPPYLQGASIIWFVPQFTLDWNLEIILDRDSLARQYLATPNTMELDSVYIDTDLEPYSISPYYACLPFEESPGRQLRFQNVLSITNSMMTDTLSTEPEEFGIDSDDLPNHPLISKKKGVWRPSVSYVYDEYRNSGGLEPFVAMPGGGYNYVTGIYADTNTHTAILSDVRTVDWHYPDRTVDNWIETDHMDRYSPYGHLVETTDINAVKTSASYHPVTNMPQFTAANAGHPTVFFEDFESYQPLIHSGTSLPISDLTVQTASHTGRNSLRLESTGMGGLPARVAQYLKTDIAVDSLNPTSLLIRFWVKSGGVYKQPPLVSVKITPQTSSSCPDVTLATELVAEVSGWKLMECQLDTCDFTGYIDIDLINDNPEAVFVDDILIQPYDAEVTCYVYDETATNRLLAQFDANHFPTVYTYDLEDRLAAVYKETVRGKKLVSETDYNTPQKLRDRYSGIEPTYALTEELPLAPPQFEQGLKQLKVMPGGSTLDNWRREIYDLDYSEREELIKEAKESNYLIDTAGTEGLGIKTKLIDFKMNNGSSKLELLDGVIDVPVNDSIPTKPTRSGSSDDRNSKGKEEEHNNLPGDESESTEIDKLRQKIIERQAKKENEGSSKQEQKK